MLRKRSKCDSEAVDRKLNELDQKTKAIETRVRRIEVEVGILRPQTRIRRRPA